MKKRKKDPDIIDLSVVLIPMTVAGRLEVVQKLLGGQPIFNDIGEKIGETESVITPEQAKKLLELAYE